MDKKTHLYIHLKGEQQLEMRTQKKNENWSNRHIYVQYRWISGGHSKQANEKQRNVSANLVSGMRIRCVLILINILQSEIGLILIYSNLLTIGSHLSDDENGIDRYRDKLTCRQNVSCHFFVSLHSIRTCNPFWPCSIWIENADGTPDA